MAQNKSKFKFHSTCDTNRCALFAGKFSGQSVATSVTQRPTTQYINLDKLENGTVFLLPVTDNEDTMPENDPAEVVACKTKKGRKRIRAKAPSSLRKKSKTSASAQTPTLICKSPHRSYSPTTPKNN
ncbi:11670_t:CDS:2 [Dentiscutata erythropus]|uniref:11670_t:CDS:1 n=1 Tax=Dentiscutata erythropus TaxID=1348616 RepID=A0A9N9C1F8_9GLOM|nr:11670_t:CDS:2 [Dentiscutata erythropus]